MRIRSVALTLALLLVASACSSDDADGASSDTSSPGDAAVAPTAGADGASPVETDSAFSVSDVSERQWASARALAAAHGAEGGFAAEMLAFERGYDVVQIMDAALANRLDVNGHITIDGSLLSPTGSRAGVMSLPENDDTDGDGASGAAATAELTLVGFQSSGQVERARLYESLVFGAERLAPDLFAEARNFDITTADPAVAAALILALAESGYSPAQITDALTQQTVLGLDTIGQESGIAGVEGSCAALYDEGSGTLLAPVGYTGLDCGQVVNSLSTAPDPPTPDPLVPTTVPAVPEFATYRGAASPAALDATVRASGGYGSFTFDAGVDTGTADISINYTYLSWVRGGAEDAGPTGDQNCGIIVSASAAGSGASGSPTDIALTVISSSIVDTVGALCEGADFSFYLHEPGDGLGRFVGQLNGLGLSGEYTGVFQTNRVQLEAAPE